jgi:DNA-binding MarR family transcriptional regulator
MNSRQPVPWRVAGDEFHVAFWAAKRAMTEATEAAFQRHGVRAGQQFILRCLWAEDCLAPGEIARRLELATPTVTRAATRMEAAGLLTRQPHTADARLVRLCLTDRGRALEQVIDQEMAKLTERALATLTEDERAALVGHLVQIRRNIAASAG